MAAPNTNALLDQARCVESCVPEGARLSVLITIFANIAGMSLDTNTLVQNARCVDSCIPAGMQLAVLIYLAQQILDGGGGGSGSGNLTGFGSPVGAVLPTAAGLLYSDKTAPYGLWLSTGVTNTDWVRLLGNP